MSDIKTWHERAMAHPDHQSGMVSEGMLRARMCEEIADLRSEVERLREALRWYADLTNYMPPVVVVFDEPPALLDKGALAREALEAKP